MTEPARDSLHGVVAGLLFAENLGDVHDEWNLLCNAAGLGKLDGNYLTGFPPRDARALVAAIRFAVKNEVAQAR